MQRERGPGFPRPREAKNFEPFFVSMCVTFLWAATWKRVSVRVFVSVSLSLFLSFSFSLSLSLSLSQKDEDDLLVAARSTLEQGQSWCFPPQPRLQ